MHFSASRRHQTNNSKEEEEGGGGREDTNGLPGLFTSGNSNTHRLDARHRVAPPPANQNKKKINVFVKQFKKKKVKLSPKRNVK